MIPASTLAELERLERLATAGPWHVGRLDQLGQRIVESEHIELFTGWHHCVGSIEKEMEANAQLIAALRNHAKALIASARLVEEMEEALKAARRHAELIRFAPERRHVIKVLDAVLAKLQLERNLSCSTDPGFAERMRKS